MRSLGGYYFARGDYPNTVACLRKAVAINPLLSRSWFILGCAYIRQEDWEGAREAFLRCVSIDDEDAESWNNLASMYLRMGEVGTSFRAEQDPDEQVGLDVLALRPQLTSRDTSQTEPGSDNANRSDDKLKRVPFDNKVLAFRALKQGLKNAYENWRMWNNYMVVAVDVGELSEACRALARVVEERSAKDGADCVDYDVLERLVDAANRVQVERTPGSDQSEDAGRHPREGLLRQVSDLFDRVILPRVSSSRIFRAKARLLTAQDKWEDALAAYMDAYRSGAAGTMEKGETDVQKWKEAVTEVEDIVDVLRNFGPKAEGSKWQLQARSIVRTFMGRTRDFEDEADWARLTRLQEELRQED